MVFSIPFRMLDAAAGAHHLDVACFGAAFITHGVLVGDRARADIGDDFHVPVAVWRKAGLWTDLVVIPDPELPVAHAGRVVILGEREMIMGAEPLIPECTEPFERSDIDHGFSPVFYFRKRNGAASLPRQWDVEQMTYAAPE